MRFNRDHNLAGQARLGAVLEQSPQGGVSSGNRDAAEAAAEKVAEFYRGLGMPTRLRDVGVPQQDLPAIAHDTMTDFALHRNVRRVKDVSELVELLTQMW